MKFILFISQVGIKEILLIIYWIKWSHLQWGSDDINFELGQSKNGWMVWRFEYRQPFKWAVFKRKWTTIHIKVDGLRRKWSDWPKMDDPTVSKASCRLRDRSFLLMMGHAFWIVSSRNFWPSTLEIHWVELIWKKLSNNLELSHLGQKLCCRACLNFKLLRNHIIPVKVKFELEIFLLDSIVIKL